MINVRIFIPVWNFNPSEINEHPDSLYDHSPLGPDLAATAEGLSKHEIPEWWRDAKLGIFIHWGVYSVPGYAPVDETEPENLRNLTDAEGQLIKMRGMPYAEWYYNTLRLNGSKTAAFHKTG